MINWKLLNKDEYRHVWNKVYNKFEFKPSMKSSAQCFNIKQDYIVYDISHIWGNKGFESLYKDLEERMLEVFKFITEEEEEIYALDWQHDCYVFNPRGEMLRDEFGEWLVPILPDGDYYFFIHKDFEWGYLGHPWHKTITIFGDKLIRGIKYHKPILLCNIKKEMIGFSGL